MRHSDFSVAGTDSGPCQEMYSGFRFVRVIGSWPVPLHAGHDSPLLAPVPPHAWQSDVIWTMLPCNGRDHL